VKLDVFPTLTRNLCLQIALELRTVLSTGLFRDAENISKLDVRSAIALNLIAKALVGRRGVTARPEESLLGACDRHQGDSPHG